MDKHGFTLDLGRYKLKLSERRSRIMGILNLTPDSFSGDGMYPAPVSKIVDRAQKMVEEGADILDIGGESSRPGSMAVPLKEELKRTIPAIRALSKSVKVPLSIDTCKPEVARAALENGAVIINDIRGFRNPKMARLAAKKKAAVIIMHMKGMPRTMQRNPSYKCLIKEIVEFLADSIKSAIEQGIDRNKIIIDPGIGFGKSREHNLEIIKKLESFKSLGRPILVGPSRKSFIGKVLKTAPQERVFGTVSVSVVAVKNGAGIVRTHDVKEVRQALKMLDALNRTK
ncbi:dihydropteroate synthase [Candidatus Omnitrophota bacterium]